jgi:hypothetical protein
MDSVSAILSEDVLDAAAILSADDCSPTRVFVPEWHGHVYLKVMSGTDRTYFELQWAEKPPETYRSMLLALTLCDASGKLLFGRGQIAALGNKSSVVLDRLVAVARRLNLMDDGAAESLEKKSENRQFCDSGLS